MFGNGKYKKKTYAELQSEAAQLWSEIARIREQKFAMIHQDITNSPDVKATPDPSVKWSMDGIVCPDCHGQHFYITIWRCINGQRHRFEGKCVACQRVHVYDWNEKAWVA